MDGNAREGESHREADNGGGGGFESDGFRRQCGPEAWAVERRCCALHSERKRSVGRLFPMVATSALKRCRDEEDLRGAWIGQCHTVEGKRGVQQCGVRSSRGLVAGSDALLMVAADGWKAGVHDGGVLGAWVIAVVYC
jgi:hypothetical protein